ncbi:metallophosphoesterase [Waterburya agarophytonicola K14]|uniref:Metallophosphoesterase n=1 Tax=Waterburya agarophytonicola KI4 TaxID=2874699 RepID=A0A964BTH7_9CYAN|nr:metallophosphoesterase [Waterburya agarophytonicola]MCC0178824.1 metallophosphoesterase [Waterburya agarophytonicola KI4]
MKSIAQKLKYTALGIANAIILLVIWSFIEPRMLNVENETAEIPNLPASWSGKQIAQLTDFQIGLWGDNRGTARRSVAKIVEAKPAIALISGDFLYHPGENITPEIETAVDIVRPLVEAGIPTYAVLGNHDYGMSSKKATPKTQEAERLEIKLEAAGIKVLENEVVQLPLSGSNEPLYLVGVGSLWASRDNVDKALDSVPDSSPRIVMIHNPDTFEQFPVNSAPLAVAGHTHGGQVRVPGLPQWSWLRFTQKDKVYADGWAKGFGEPSNRLYVNRGIGMSIAPIRLFCRPELTFFTLQPEEVS